MKKDISYSISFNKINGLGPVKLYAVMEYFESLEEAWLADISEFKNIPILNDKDLEQISNERQKIEPEKELEKIIKSGVKAIALSDNEYPEFLKKIHDPPFVIFYKGNYDKNFFSKCVGIVGTRKPSYSGKKTAFNISKELSELGITVVSGLAAGIDTEVHKGALKADNGITVAVTGCGPDVVYPESNRKLYEEIVERGLVISAYEPNTPPDAWRFPARNRLISGVSKGSLIVESAEKSGALITMDFALEQGREVMAIPGDLSNPMSKGPNNLIKQGAVLVTEVADILNCLNWKIEKKETHLNLVQDDSHNIENLNLNEQEREIYLFLDDKPKHLDYILGKVNLPLSDITSNLIMLELKQLIKQLPGKLFIKV
jgi:DNA processing protein